MGHNNDIIHLGILKIEYIHKEIKMCTSSPACGAVHTTILNKH